MSEFSNKVVYVSGGAGNLGQAVTKAFLDKKVIHHRIEHDVVSAGFKTNTPFGKVKTYKLKKESDSKTKSIFKSIIGMHPLIKMKRMSEKSLNAHSLSNFTEHKT